MSFRVLTLLVLFSILLFEGKVWAQNFTDTQVKAAYIQKLVKFVTWDGQHLNHYNFCYLESTDQGDASVGGVLRKLVHAQDGGNWSIKKLKSADGVSGCNILFIAESEEGSISEIMQKIQSMNIFTMSDIRNAIHKGVMLGFVLDEKNHVKMEANLNTIRSTKVMVSANVLELMVQVIK